MFPSTYYHRRLYNDWWDRPSQNVGLLDDPFFHRSSLPYYLRPRRMSALDGGDSETHSTETSQSMSKAIDNNNGSSLYSNLADEKTGSAEMSNQQDKFTVNVDVSHFAPDEIQVKVTDNMLIIEANHEEKLDEHGGFVTRSFKRRYELPPDANAQGVVSDLNNDGILTIQAPKVHVAPPKERVIPVQFSANAQPKGILKRKN